VKLKDIFHFFGLLVISLVLVALVVFHLHFKDLARLLLLLIAIVAGFMAVIETIEVKKRRRRR